MSTIDKIIYGSQTLEVVDTEARSQIAGKADKEEGKTLSTNDLTNELKTNYDAAYAHISDTNNPHNITPEAINAAKSNHNHDSLYVKNAYGTIYVDDELMSNATGSDNLEFESGDGINLSIGSPNNAEFSVKVNNAGVRSVSAGTTDGTISVNTNGTTSDVAIKGFENMATKDYAKNLVPHTISETVVFTVTEMDENRINLLDSTAKNAYIRQVDSDFTRYDSNKSYFIRYANKDYPLMLLDNYVMKCDTTDVKLTIEPDIVSTYAQDPEGNITIYIYRLNGSPITDLQLITKEVQYLENQYLEKDLSVVNNLTVGGKIVQYGTPTNNEDVATKKYVDDNKVSVDGLATEEYVNNVILSKAVPVELDDTDIILTTDKYQYVSGLTGNSSQSTLVWFPSVDESSSFEEIHLYIFDSSIKNIVFDTIISWKYNQVVDNSIVPNPNYIYEFIFTYINAKWIGEMIVHTNSYTPEKNVDLVNKKYVDDKVAEIVNSAPETLDTLQELATALGNDANFATTMTNSLANKADKDHVHAQYLTEHQDISGKVDKIEGKGLSTNDLTADLKANYDAAYAHSQIAHAPANAQKNSDITKAEIEAKLTGDVTTHAHSQYLTEHQDLSEYAKTTDIPSINGLATTEYVDSKTFTENVIYDGDGTGDIVIFDYWTHCPVNEGLGCWVINKSIEFDSSKPNPYYLLCDNTLYSPENSRFDKTNSAWIYDDRSEIFICNKYNDENKLVLPWDGAGSPQRMKLFTKEEIYLKVADAHVHSNKAVLDAITAEKVAQWDSNTGSGGGTTSGIKIETKSQSDYEALETKDPNTLYLITTTNAGTVDATSNDITLSDDLPAGTYTLKYEDENNQPLEGFDEITTMEVQ